ncbi:MAG: rhamnogalacturonan acetylesterase [Prevotella sp.]|nr:rhamnogalacturonan acetylesterase [Prevotella sp.]
MKNYRLLALIMVGLLFTPFVKALADDGDTEEDGATYVFTIGDSTMSSYDESTTDRRGWGMMFQQFFDESLAKVQNYGHSGTSSKSFYNDDWTNTVKKQVRAGDYVLIQFAHNDENTDGMDGDSVIAAGYSSETYEAKGTTPTIFKEYLSKYIADVRAIGAKPILVSPICRKYFSSGSITRVGRHDLGDSFSILKDGKITTENKLDEEDHSMDYPYAMKEVADSLDVPFIDITTISKEMFEDYGIDQCTAQLFADGDNTHLQALGATLIAQKVANALVSEGIMAGDTIKQDASLLINPSSVDYGQIYVGKSVVKEVSVMGYGLDSSNSSLSISATDGFVISTDKESYSNTLTLTITDEGEVDYTIIYVKAQPTEGGEITGTLTFSYGEESSETVSLSCEGVSLAAGDDVLLTWPLTSNTKDAYTLTGNAEAVPESWSKMEVQSYSSNSLTWPDDTPDDVTSSSYQRNQLSGQTTSGSWPGGEIDEVVGRFIDFGIKAKESTTLYIDSIGMYVGAAGGSGMACRIVSLVEHSSGTRDSSVIAEYTSMESGTMYAVSSQPVIIMEAGDSMIVRLFPWYKSEATSKYFCLSNVTIHGVSVSTDENGGGEEEEVEIPDGNEIILNWALSTDTAYTLKEIKGEETITEDVEATAIGQNLSSLEGIGQKNPGSSNGGWTWEDGINASTQYVQCYQIAESNGLWPANDAMTSTRYAEYGISAIDSTTLYIDSIGLYVGGYGGDFAKCQISYIVKDSVGEQKSSVDIVTDKALTKNTMSPVSYSKTITLAAGDSLLVRVYPWASSEQTSAKYFAISGVTIHGVVVATEEEENEEENTGNEEEEIVKGDSLIFLNWELAEKTDYTLKEYTLDEDGTETLIEDVQASAIGVNLSGLTSADYKYPSTTNTSGETGWDWEDNSNLSTQKVQLYNIEDETWPGNDSLTSTRYAEYGISATDTTKLYIDSIGLYVGGYGTGNIMCQICYFVKDSTGVKNTTVILESKQLTQNTMTPISYTKTITLEAGDTLLVRVYPWNKSSLSMSSKYLAVYDVTLTGWVTPSNNGSGDTTGISTQSENTGVAVKEMYYDLSGARISSKPQRGIYILKEVYGDGSVKVSKIAR